ncbi:uncharacterized protein LOC126653670 [Mercurialis annua]|uniref:uncharacterized protein LOC126653670 n=1 Tax=Mercurialis annua TaxID=3986 RepID=UPI002160BCEE|nr:uncharacterized protein LOC126653670 [Mercurialis annua]
MDEEELSSAKPNQSLSSDTLQNRHLELLTANFISEIMSTRYLMSKLQAFEKELTQYKQRVEFNGDINPNLEVCEKAMQDLKLQLLMPPKDFIANEQAVQDRKSQILSEPAPLTDFDSEPDSDLDSEPDSDFVSGVASQEIQEEQVGLNSLKAVFRSFISEELKVNQLIDKLTRFKGKVKSIEGLEPKIHVLLQTGDRDNFFHKEDYQEEGKNMSFLDYLSLFHESDLNDGYETLVSLRTRAVDQGKNLSRKLIHVIFMMSKAQETVFKLQALRDSLSWIGEGESTMVVNKFIDLLHTADIEMFKKRGSLKRKAAVLCDETEAAVGCDETEAAEYDHSDYLIFFLLKEICRLELFWMHRGLPDPKMSMMTDTFRSLEDGMRDCERQLKMFKSQYLNMVDGSAFGFQEEDFLSMRQKDEYKAMELKMGELWNGIEESGLEVLLA